MNLLIDTNVILDMVLNRSGCDISLQLFRKIKSSGFRAYITASTVTDLFYIIHKNTHDTEQTYTIIENIFKLVDILSVSEYDIHDALQKKWRDFEDCVQFVVACNNKIDYIITSNHKDFIDKSLPVISPKSFLDMLD